MKTIMRLERLRSFLLLHPPLVVFIFCIGMTGIAFVSFAYYIKFNKIRNHDVQKDWNAVVSNASKINFCSNNFSNYLQMNDSFLDTNYLNISLHLNIVLNIPANTEENSLINQFDSSFNSSVLGYSDSVGEKLVHLNFALYRPFNFSCHHPNGCTVTLSSCVTISAPQEVFPEAKPWPVSCRVPVNKTDASKHFSASLPSGELGDFCSSTLMKISHEEEERFYIYLTVETRSHVHDHLLRSSYFLFLVVAVVLLFGILRGSHHHSDKKSSHSATHLLS